MNAEPEALTQMRSRGGTWYAYENVALDSATFGHTQFLKCGPGCANETPPPQMPDTSYGMGWKYRLAGKVNLETGEVERG